MPDGSWVGRLTASLFLPEHADHVRVHAIRGREEVSRAFRYEIDFSARGIDLSRCLRREVQIGLESPNGESRWISGIAVEASVAPSARGMSRFRIVLGPRQAMIRWRSGYRIFREQSVPDIVRAVFLAAGIPGDWCEWLTTQIYPVRDYVVQHDESEWDFVCRLLEEEGIWFSFRHDETGHVMVLRDDSTLAERVGPSPLRYSAEALERMDLLRAWGSAEDVCVSETKVSLDDYDMLHPTKDLRAGAATDDAIQAEWYEHPGRYEEPEMGKRLAPIRLAERRQGRRRAKLSSNAISIAAGGVIDLLGHPRVDGERFVVALDLDVSLNGGDEADDGPLVASSAGQSCVVSLDTMAIEERFAPARSTPRPRVLGLRTARVVGPESEEIHCDEHGRVKLEQHWDLDGKLDGKSSCWVRVTQPHTTGSVLIPRTGWEVLVEHVSGDPDRPLCLGRVYDAQHMPAYQLPQEKTVSGIRSDSSPGGGGINEIRLDDSAGGETFSIVAKRNVLTTVTNDRTQQVEKTASRKVGRHRRVEITGPETITVGEDENARVNTLHEIDVIGSRTVRVSGGSSLEVTRNVDVDVKGREQVRVGNPLDAVLAMAKEKAIQAAQGLAAKGVNAAQESLGPMAVMNAARGELGALGRFAGPAGAPAGGPGAALFGGGSLPGPLGGGGSLLGDGGAGDLLGGAGELLGGGGDLLGGGGAAVSAAGRGGAFGGRGGRFGGSAFAPGLPGRALPAFDADSPADDPAVAAAGLAASVVDGAFEKLGLGGGGGGGGAGAGGGATKGSGTWGIVVEKRVTEHVGGAATIASGTGISFGVGKDAKERIGLARTELIRGGKAESVAEKKIETVGAYVLEVKTSLAVTAKYAIVRTIAGRQKQKITGSHTLSAKLVAGISTKELTLEASDKLTLTCGQSELVIGSDGVSIKGKEILFQADEIIVAPPAIKKK